MSLRAPVARLVCLGALLIGLLPSDARAAGFTIVVDPGHGGAREGAHGPEGLLEKEIALQIALRLEAALQARGHEVHLTRSDDSHRELADRIALANERQADVFLSLHANSMPTEAARRRTHGIETYFLSAHATDEAAAALARAENADHGAKGGAAIDGVLGSILADLARSEAHADSSRLAYAVHGRLIEATGRRDGGVRQAPFFVLEGAKMPAVLVEVGYISHPRESKQLADAEEQQTIAAAIADGISRFLRGLSEKQGPAAEAAFQVPRAQRIE